MKSIASNSGVKLSERTILLLVSCVEISQELKSLDWLLLHHQKCYQIC